METTTRIRGGMSKCLAAVAALLIAMLCLSLFPSSAHASIVQSGDLSDSVSWSLDDQGNLLIAPKNGVSGSFSRETDLDDDWPWDTPQVRPLIQTATVSSGVTVTDDTRTMFQYCENLTSVDLSGLNTSSVTQMSNMFQLCTSLTSANLDIS